MKNVALYNLGCKVNSYETEGMRQALLEKGYNIVPFDQGADIYIVNTCTVTNIADRKSRQMLHRAKLYNPQAVVVAVGCYVQTGQDALERDGRRKISLRFWRNFWVPGERGLRGRTKPSAGLRFLTWPGPGSMRR